MANIWSCPLVFVFEQSRSWNYTSPSCWPINISFFLGISGHGKSPALSKIFGTCYPFSNLKIGPTQDKFAQPSFWTCHISLGRRWTRFGRVHYYFFNGTCPSEIFDRCQGY